MTRATLLLTAALALVSVEAKADQCAYIQPEEAQRATKLLSEGQRVVDFCEPCGDAEPSEPRKIQRAEHRDVDYEGYHQVYLDDGPVDLAYVFAETAPGRFENLAKLTGCEAHGVSPVLELEPEPSEPEASPDCLEVTEDEPSSAGPVVHVSIEASHDDERRSESDWMSFVLGGLLLAPAWGSVWFGLWLFRRRRWGATPRG